MAPLKYRPLGDFLAAQPPGTVSVALTLPEIERLVGRPLPPSAHTPKWWWNMVDNPQSQVWMDRGWRVAQAQVQQPPGLIVFERASRNSTL